MELEDLGQLLPRLTEDVSAGVPLRTIGYFEGGRAEGGSVSTRISPRLGFGRQRQSGSHVEEAAIAPAVSGRKR